MKVNTCFLFPQLVSSRSDAASSSGYESMRNDASHASSDSCSEKGFSRGKRKGKNYKYFSWYQCCCHLIQKELLISTREITIPSTCLFKYCFAFQDLTAEAGLRPRVLVPGSESTHPGAGSRESPWSQFRSRFMKLTIWRGYKKL